MAARASHIEHQKATAIQNSFRSYQARKELDHRKKRKLMLERATAKYVVPSEIEPWLEEATSGVRPASWSHFKADQFSIPQVDVKGQVGLHIDTSSLYDNSTVGSMAGLQRFMHCLDQLLQSGSIVGEFKTYLEDAYQKCKRLKAEMARREAGKGSKADTTVLPLELIETVLHMVEDISVRVTADREKLRDLATEKLQRLSEVNANEGRLQDLFKLQKADNGVSASDLDEDPSAGGWSGAWWDLRTRERVNNMLAAKLDYWKDLESRDELSDVQIRLMSTQIQDLLASSAILQQLGRTTTYNSFMDQDRSFWDPMNRIMAQVQSYHDKLHDDKAKLKKHMDSSTKQHQTYSKQHAKRMKDNAKHLDDVDIRVETLQEEIRQAEAKYLKELDEFEEEELDAGVNREAVNLKFEIVKIKLGIEKSHRQIEKMEAEIIESDKRFDRYKEKLVEDAKIRIAKARESMEAHYKNRVQRLNIALGEARKEQAAKNTERSDVDKAEVKRLLKMSSEAKVMGKHSQRLDNTVEQHEDLLKLVRTATDLCKDLAVRADDFVIEIHDDHRIGLNCIEALEWSAKLTNLLNQLEEDKESRIAGVDKSIKLHLSMLEFCVDTHDPNAHMHQTVIDELTTLRKELEAEVDNHEAMEKYLLETASGLVKTVEQPHIHEYVKSDYLKLRESQNAFFDTIPAASPQQVHKTPKKARACTRKQTPCSKFVKPKTPSPWRGRPAANKSLPQDSNHLQPEETKGMNGMNLREETKATNATEDSALEVTADDLPCSMVNDTNPQQAKPGPDRQAGSSDLLATQLLDDLESYANPIPKASKAAFNTAAPVPATRSRSASGAMNGGDPVASLFPAVSGTPSPTEIRKPVQRRRLNKAAFIRASHPSSYDPSLFSKKGLA